ncbi:hypothetical protein BGZ80_007172, partial [Entomortierella chlamydospora]
MSQISSASQIPYNTNFAIDSTPAASSLVVSFSDTDKDAKDTLHNQIQEVIKQFDNDFISFASVQELVALATIQDYETFLGIVSLMLKVLQDSLIQLNIVLQGLAVTLNSLRSEID